MKRVLLIILFLSNFVFAYKQHVHQYISMEAYKLLKMSLGSDVRMMKDRLGDLSSYYVGDRPWQRGYITTGAWREDMEDVVYGYSNNHLPDGATGEFITGLIKAMNNNNEYYSSITHFWYADYGDNLRTTMTAGAHFLGILTVQTFTMENAYQKLQKFVNGGWIANYTYETTTGCPSAAFGAPQNYPILGIAFEYSNLIEFFKTGKAYARGHQNLAGYWSYVSPTEIFLGQEFRERICFEILGRMCHLLQDMSIPAHANIDPHGTDLGKLPWQDDALIPDYYEEYFGYDYYWNYQNTFSQVGGYINPYQSSNPLHFLMYTTNQMSNHFATQGPHYNPPNDYFSGNPLPEEISYLNSLNVSSFGNPTSINGPFDQASIDNVRSHLFPQAIRATAGLLYWFAKEADLLPIPLTGAYVSGTYDLYLDQTGNWYAQPLNGLEPFTYNWEIKYLDGAGYLQTYESVKKEKEKREKDKDKKKDGDIIIETVISNYWFSVGTNSSIFSKTNNSYDYRDFMLRCTVTDGSSTTKTSNEWFVDVLSTSPPQYAVEDNGGLKQEKYLAKVTEDETIPKEFSLEQNYPNPFNPTTRISYSLPEANFVTLKIYDMLGREVATLVNENKPAGKFEVEFDASKLSSGIYVYKLVAGHYQITKKMQLVK